MAIVLTGGKFNRIHPGHVRLLKKATRLGTLVVVLAHDTRNNRPYALPASKRKKALEALGIADRVVIGRKDGFVNIVKKVRPDVIVLGYDQSLPDDVRPVLKKMNIRVVRMMRFGRHATRALVRARA